VAGEGMASTLATGAQCAASPEPPGRVSLCPGFPGTQTSPPRAAPPRSGGWPTRPRESRLHWVPVGGPPGYDLATLALDAPHPARPAPPAGQRTANPDPDLFWSLSFALSAAAWSRVGGFHEGYAGYGGEDTDFGRLLLAAGLGPGWLGSARAGHQWHEVENPPRRHLDDILRNGALFATRWGTWPMGGWLAAFEREGLVRRTDGGWERTGG